jgi:hypothetical protein
MPMPRSPNPTPTERVEQRNLVRWACYTGVRKHLFAIPNGGLRDKRVAANLKLEGVEPGASDLMLAIPSNGKHGLFLEMKRKQGSKLTELQKIFMDKRIASGYEAKVAYGWEHGVQIITEYLGGSLNAFGKQN